MEVSILPLQRTLEVDPGANLLEALLSHQVPISYSCMAGRCGTCRCRIVAGDIQVTGSPDSHFPDSEGRSVLACQSTVIENCVIEIPEVDEIVTHPSRIIKATVVGIENLTHDIKRVRLALSRRFDFSPGQYATLQFTPEHIRPYSMALTSEHTEAEFHIRLVADGRVTSYVATELKAGDAVRLSGPLGTAYLRRKSAAPVICIAGGTGLAPILSILRGMAEARMWNPIQVYFGVRSPQDVYGIQWLDELQEQLPNMSYQTVVATAAESDRYRTGGVIDAVNADLTELSGWRAYVAGAPVLVEAASILLRNKGVESEHIYADAFYSTGV